MDRKKIIKLIVFNLVIAVLAIILFSEGLIGLEIVGGSSFETAFAAAVIVVSLIIFGLGNYKFLFTEQKPITTLDLKTTEDCIAALKRNKDKQIFAKNIDNILEQLERFSHKKETIIDILLQKFNGNEISYAKFESVVLDVERVFYINIKSIINKLNAFDEEDYNFMQSKGAQNNYSAEFRESKMNIYDEYINFVKEAIADNEVILLKLDQLLLEISKFNSLEEGAVEDMPAVKEIDELIANTKLFKR